MYFSEELYNAKKYGYEFEILRGYTFDKAIVFKEYVDNLYNLRLQFPKSDPMNYISKLLLNSLYGRFGMDDSFITTKILPKKEYLKLEELYINSILEVLPLKSNFIGEEDNYLIQYKDPQIDLNTLSDNASETHNVNIAIASAITAYARIHMSQFKNNNTLPFLYYSDTDSLYFDGPIDASFINSVILGKLKLEGIYDQAVFLAPKVYALKNDKESIIKIKGLNKESIIKNNITLDSLEILLNKDYNLIINQNKWFRSLSEGNIQILEQTYNLKVTGNKRELVFE
jgi:hypothetical protein